jgi:predicted anti-sigma-YlaC factor YlaD
MDSCELHQITLSSFLDGEASPEELRPALDHLTVCDACREFYRELRRLERICDELPLQSPVRANAKVKARGSSLLAPWRLVPRWAWGWGAAAAVVLVSILWGPELRTREPARDLAPAVAAGQPVSVTLGESRGQMTDERFLQLALELLRSDGTYRETMYAVLSQVRAPQVAGGEVVLRSADYRVGLGPEGLEHARPATNTPPEFPTEGVRF